MRRASPIPAEVEAFRQGLRDLGYIEGQTIHIEQRYADGMVERLPGLAAELVRLHVEVLVVDGSPTASAAKTATATIPIVFTLVSDPVGNGFVASLAQPGGNMTGLASLSRGLGGKHLELLKEAVPSLTRVAILHNPASVMEDELQLMQGAAESLALRLQSLEARSSTEWARAFSAMTGARAEAVYVRPDATFSSQRERLVELVNRARLPAMFTEREFVTAGGLMAYGTNVPELWRRAAIYVDKILKGAKPADLPVEQPTTFELVINLKTAKTLGLTIPQSILLRADEVIR